MGALRVLVVALVVVTATEARADNAAELLALPDVDGALVGGASLEPESFAAIVGAVVS